tara:strand:- start:90 stop:230 length:141 start_codon:yes stop_codon:yes gene_type:complete
MIKLLLILSLFFIISCGGGGGNAQQPNTQPETITFKTVPDNIGIFD